MNPLGCLLAPGIAAAGGLMVSMIAPAQSPAVARDLARQLSERIAAAVAPLAEIRLSVIDTQDDEAAVAHVVAAELETMLRDRGIRLLAEPQARESEQGGRASVRVMCSANLREHVCAAEIDKGGSRDVAIVSTARDSAAEHAHAPVMALDLRPLFAGEVPILDLAVLDERSLVLDAAGIALYERTGQTRQVKASVPLPAARPWPRDARGRLQVEGNGLSAFLPGLTCRGTVDPLAIKCAEGSEPWPVGIPAATLAAGVNYFTSGRTPSFFSAASIQTATGSGWLLAATDGRLLLVDGALDIRRALPPIGDDIGSVVTTCGGGRQVIGASSVNGAAGDSLRGYEVVGGNPEQVTPTVSMPGRVTALWEATGTPFVLVVVRNASSDRYEAFHVGISCAR